MRAGMDRRRHAYHYYRRKAMWKYGDAVSRDDVEKVMQFTESLLKNTALSPPS